jgi:hypothetical protein
MGERVSLHIVCLNDLGFASNTDRLSFLRPKIRPESVRCDVCKKYFHMRCVTPPLTSKPAKGYGWTCAPCYRRHEQTVALESGGLGSSSSSASAAAIESAATGTAPNGLALPAAGSVPQESTVLNQQYIKARLAASGSRGGRPRNSGGRYS